MERCGQGICSNHRCMQMKDDMSYARVVQALLQLIAIAVGLHPQLSQCFTVWQCGRLEGLRCACYRFDPMPRIIYTFLVHATWDHSEKNAQHFHHVGY